MGWMLLLIALAFLYWLKYKLEGSTADNLNQMYFLYQKSLSELRDNPSDPELKSSALSIGRTYVRLLALAEKGGGPSAFTEVSIMNDINAACAAIPQTVAISPVGIEDKLRKLQEFKVKGLIDDSDYEKKKAEILSGM